MNIFKKLLVFLSFTIILSGCSKDEDSDKSTEPKFANFSSFEIIDNNDDLFQTETLLSSGENGIPTITNHGVELFFENKLIQRFDNGTLQNTSFINSIASYMSKGFTYTVRPFVVYNGKEYFGEFISFQSNLNIEIEIDNISPLTGFATDTVIVTGRNFCLPNNGAGNSLFLGGVYQKIISQSDSIIQAVISPIAEISTSKFSLESCRVLNSSDFEFVYDPPQLDSISSKEYYVGEKSRVYCKNLHPLHTKVWLNDIEVEVNKDRDSIIDLEFFIPKNLPPGKLDFKMEVIDRIVELKEAFQSTSPEITDIDKLSTGFLDTITIKGNYLVQPNSSTKITIGEREQTIVSASANEIKVLINQYFEESQPKLKYLSGEFKIERDIQMLPPEIISVDKTQYHLQDETVKVKTRYFLGTRSNITVAGQSLYLHTPFDGVDAEGNINLSLEDWLEITYSPEFQFIEDGKLQISISTAYGEATRNIAIIPPTIETLNEEDFYYGERLIIQGKDFGYNRGHTKVSDIYINDEIVPYSGNSNYSFRNQEIYLPIPNMAQIGKNILKIVTGGQTSNEIEFNVIEVIPEQLSVTSGTRKDIFEIVGQNLTGQVYANGAYCQIIESSESSMKFQLPYYNLLDAPSNITLTYGPHTYDVGTINGIEPYSLVQNYQPIDIFFGFTSFEYMGEFYMVTYQGIFKLNLGSGSWELIESNMGDVLSNGEKRRKGSFSNGKLYFPSEKSFQVYDLTEKRWIDDIDLNISDELDIWYSSVNDGVAYVISRTNSFRFYAYNLSTDEIIDLSQPKHFPNGIPNIFAIVNNFKSFNNRLYLELYGTIQMFDINENTWTDLGHPSRESNRQWTNIYEYDNILYFSGGLLSASTTFYDLHAYDLNSRQWSEKTYLPSMLSQHAVYGQNNKLYFFSGDGEFRYDNLKMFEYDIAQDPY